MMTTWEPLRKRGVNHANDHMLKTLAVSVGLSVSEWGASSGEKHSSANESKPRERTAHFRRRGMRGKVWRKERVQMMEAMV